MQNQSSILPRSSIDDIDITNDIMFSYVMSQNDICLKMISCLLPDIKIDRIEYTGTSSPIVQKTIPGPLEKRGVRFDVFLDDGTTVIDVEMHSSPDADIAVKSRLYQAHMDVNQLGTGESFNALKPSFLIFICKFDPFGRGLRRYTFSQKCKENDTLQLDDKAVRIFFSTTGQDGNQDTKLNRLLDYMNDTASYPEAGKEGLVKEIDDAVRMARTDEQFRSFYMLLEEKLMRERKSGYEEGIAKGEAKGKAEAAMLIAGKMLLAGMSITDIAALTGLDEAEVKKLSKIQ